MRILRILLMLLAFALTGTARAETGALQLVMVEEPGCIWCARWNQEIGPIYPLTEEGETAPLRRIDIWDETPPDLHLATAPYFTPTFILVRDGIEVGRIEGYPGEDFFWGLLGQLFDQAVLVGSEGASN